MESASGEIWGEKLVGGGGDAGLRSHPTFVACVMAVVFCGADVVLYGGVGRHGSRGGVLVEVLPTHTHTGLYIEELEAWI